MTISVLLADDDPEIRDVIRIYLQNEGYRVFESEDGVQALEMLRRESVDLIILDVMMPNMDGIRACFKIREMTKIPIIMLSAKSEDIDKITGLTTGADDYVAKPFNPLELIARVKAQLRRQKFTGAADHQAKVSNDSVVEIDELVINKNKHLVTVRGREASLTPIEFSILELLAGHRGQVFNVEQIYRSVWKEDKFLSDNTVMVHVRNIREKIEDNPREPRFIKTVWGVGYKVE
ncbi:response regulator transcription factor [Paenibacillus alginolyticus]|uniref:Response regulator transcription factor n=1 Tax=Paenibacillus alginolyticus TaxID=59839 RepID=A0ABT4GP84_9BACL|nr:response regulator transcription factor [Paenibacillus alginolyticus]MCY9667248.1 response regulator transcription factor [Paenibacillus alginolyticus]MCY9698021.1 response regulator transcription factor [Paenibacillus alginolyticus]MEC0148074.1 response regulator transcription factor [Paenibacillus alginolyticus]